MLELFNLRQEAFGLDISGRFMRIIRLKEKEGILSLVSFGETEIKPGIIENGEIKDEKYLVEIVKQALKNVSGEKLKTKYVVASLPEEKAFLQVIQLPVMENNEELRKVIYFEAENYIPLPIEEVYLDGQIVVPLHNHLDHSDALIVALPKKIVNPYLSVLKKAGLIPTVLEIESQAISRALIKNGVSPFPVLLIDFDTDKTSFIIFSGHSLRFTSSISTSFQEFTETISKSLGIDLAEAEKLKSEYGIEAKYRFGIDNQEGKVEKGRIFKALVPILEKLLKQTKEYLDYYQSHATHEHLPTKVKGVEKIILSGEGASLKGLADFLAFELKIPVEIANPWTNILPQPLKRIPELSFDKSSAYTTALGLALRGIRKEYL
jgi:type IV pilus assembly protein PilM